MTGSYRVSVPEYPKIVNDVVLEEDGVILHPVDWFTILNYIGVLEHEVRGACIANGQSVQECKAE